jgi:alpha-1,2-mannosyltransferase
MAELRHAVLVRCRSTRVAVVTACLSLLAYLVVRWLTRPSMVDLIVYRAEGQALRDGTHLYGVLPVPDGLKATYPPAAAILFEPLTAVDIPVAEVLVTLVNLTLIGVVSLLSCHLVGVPPERRVTAALYLAAAALWFEPVFTTLRYGQINLALLALVLADFTLLKQSRWCGTGIGLATALKITPAIFVVYLVVTRRFRAAGVAVCCFAATSLIGTLKVTTASRRFWTTLLFDPSRVGRVDDQANQSLIGWLTRLRDVSEPATAGRIAVGLVFVLGLGIAAVAYRRMGDLWGLPAAAITGLIGAPIAWTHHWVWCVPIAALLWQWGGRWLALMSVFCSFAVWWAIPHTGADPELNGWQRAGSGLYVICGLALLALTVVVAARAPIRPAAVSGPRASETDPRPGRVRAATSRG